MDDTQRLKLNQYIKTNNVEDQTTLIRDLKHSAFLKRDIDLLLKIVEEEKGNEFSINERGSLECNFLFMFYTDIYNKVRKQEIDLSIMNKFLEVLAKIENSELDQHEGSYLVGDLLKKIYVDSALRKAEKINNQLRDDQEDQKDDEIKISYKEFKEISNMEKTVSAKSQTRLKK